MKKRIILLLLASAPVVVAADMYVDSMTACLNDHTIPRIEEKVQAKEIVDEAYATCDKQVKEWQEGRKDLPDEMQARQDKEVYDFYIRMIDIRRKAIAAKKPD